MSDLGCGALPYRPLSSSAFVVKDNNPTLLDVWVTQPFEALALTISGSTKWDEGQGMVPCSYNLSSKEGRVRRVWGSLKPSQTI